MAEPSSPAPVPAQGTAASVPAAVNREALKKGALVRLNRLVYEGSLEAAASAPELPAYALAGPGEILAVRGEHAQIRWRRPVPDVWLRLDQLEGWTA